MSSRSGVNIRITGSGKKKSAAKVTTPKASEIARPWNIVERARFGLPAPMFCATIAEIAAAKECGGSIVKPLSFPVIPIAAAAATPPILLTVASMKMNEMLVSENCTAIGRPMRRRLTSLSHFILMLASLKSK